jgi:hypothetical protein
MFVTLFPQYFSAITQPFPPFPADFPPNFGTFGFHSRKPLVYEAKLFTREITQPFPRIAKSKPNQSRSKGRHKRSLT